jgi:hypothetical protein
LRRQFSGADVAGFIGGLSKLKVLVIGETILDDYVYCEAMGKSSKEPILALQYRSEEKHAGGSLAIANHLAEFCGTVDLSPTWEPRTRRRISPVPTSSPP